MFWWAVPIGRTGLLIAVIAILFIGIISSISGDVSKYSKGLLFITSILVLLLFIGFAMAIAGIFFWILGNIWSPYI